MLLSKVIGEIINNFSRYVKLKRTKVVFTGYATIYTLNLVVPYISHPNRRLADIYKNKIY